MAKNEYKKEIEEITKKLEEGIDNIFQGDEFQKYLDVMSKFHHYSFNNSMLIAMQNPEAELVAGYQSWQKNFNRHVKQGEKGIRILAPMQSKIYVDMPMLDEDGMQVYGEDGEALKWKKEVIIQSFRPVSVFDVSQTEGEPLPQFGVDELIGTVENYEDSIEVLKKVANIPVEFLDIPGGSHGYFSLGDNRIAIQNGMSQLQTIKTFIHEVTHSKLHNKDAMLDQKKDRYTKEVEAEAVAYVVCNHFGLDTSEYSFAYIAGWSKHRTHDELKSSLEIIKSTSAEMINEIETELEILVKGREATEQSIAEIIDREATYEIYQLSENLDQELYHRLAFSSLKEIKEEGFEVNKENYTKKYEGNLSSLKGYEENILEDMLDDIYEKFNIAPPSDFKGHSLSVSDVIVICDENGSHPFYVDSFGFATVQDFERAKESSERVKTDKYVEIVFSESDRFQKEERIPLKEFDDRLRIADSEYNKKHDMYLKQYGSYEEWEKVVERWKNGSELSDDERDSIKYAAPYEKVKFRIVNGEQIMLEDIYDIGSDSDGLLNVIYPMDNSAEIMESIFEASKQEKIFYICEYISMPDYGKINEFFVTDDCRKIASNLIENLSTSEQAGMYINSENDKLILIDQNEVPTCHVDALLSLAEKDYNAAVKVVKVCAWIPGLIMDPELQHNMLSNHFKEEYDKRVELISECVSTEIDKLTLLKDKTLENPNANDKYKAALSEWIKNKITELSNIDAAKFNSIDSVYEYVDAVSMPQEKDYADDVENMPTREEKGLERANTSLADRLKSNLDQVRHRTNDVAASNESKIV